MTKERNIKKETQLFLCLEEGIMEQESRRKNSGRNIIFGYTSQIFSLVLNFIGRAVFIKILGEEYLGINGLFSDILTMLSMADLGFGTAMSYSFYKPVAEHDEEKIAALIHYYKKIYHIIAAMTALIGILLIPFLKYLINMDSQIPYLNVYYLFFLTNTVVSYLFVYKTSIISASQKNYLISKYQIIVNTVKTMMQIGVLVIFENYFFYMAITIAATLFNNLLASWKAGQLYPAIHSGYKLLDEDSRKSIVKNMQSIFLYKISSVFLNGTDNMLISVIVGTIWVGVYSNYNLLITGINNFIGILFTSVTASIGNLVVTEKSQKQYHIFRITNMAGLMIASVSVAVMANLMNDFIFLWLGERFILEERVMIAILCNFYLCNILRPIWSYREATGLYIQTKYIMLIAAIVNVVLSVILGYCHGMAGIIFASVIARISTYFWYEPRLLFQKYFEKGAREYYVSILKNMVFTVLLSSLLYYISANYRVDAWWKLFMKAAVTGTASIACVAGFYIRTEEMKTILREIMAYLKKWKEKK